MQERAFGNPKIDFIWNTQVVEILGDREVKGVKLWNHVTDEITEMPIEGVFIAIGHDPNTEIFRGQLPMDAQGYLVLEDPGRSMTEVEGVFAAGDVHDHVYRQAVTAAGAGCRAAMDAERFLERLGEASGVAGTAEARTG
jgi:thioredoxin reductase (NADPH)